MNLKEFIEKAHLSKNSIEGWPVKINTEKLTVKCPKRSNNNSSKHIGK